jgi:hypothetical protein
VSGDSESRAETTVEERRDVVDRREPDLGPYRALVLLLDRVRIYGGRSRLQAGDAVEIDVRCLGIPRPLRMRAKVLVFGREKVGPGGSPILRLVVRIKTSDGAKVVSLGCSSTHYVVRPTKA